MLKLILDFLLNLVATLVQIITLPINLIISNALPDISNTLLDITNGLSTLFDSMTWAVGILPPMFVEFLLILLTIEIAYQLIVKSTYGIGKIWRLLQKIKFW